MQVDQPVDLKYMAPIPYGAAPDWMTAGDAAHLTAAQIEGLKMPQSTAEWEHAMTTASEYLIEAGAGEFATGDEAKAHHVFESTMEAKAGGGTETVVKFDYALIPDLPAEQLQHFRAVDTNGNGAIELHELVDLQVKRQNYKQLVVYLAGLLIVLILACFGLSIAASIMVQATKANPSHPPPPSQRVANPLSSPQETAAKAGQMIPAGEAINLVQTTPAEQNVPVAIASLLSDADLAKVKELLVSNLVMPGGQPCTTCGQGYIMQVEEVVHASDLKVTFKRTNGMAVEVDRGAITVSNVPGQNPATRFAACAKATCSAIRVAGIDVNAIKAKAKSLNFLNTGDRRSGAPCVGGGPSAPKAGAATMEPSGEAKVTEEAKPGAGVPGADSMQMAKAGSAAPTGTAAGSGKPAAPSSLAKKALVAGGIAAAGIAAAATAVGATAANATGLAPNGGDSSSAASPAGSSSASSPSG